MIDISKAVQKAAQNVNNRPDTKGRLGGKLAIVTGSAQGFGLGIAECMIAEGASVAIADLNYDMAKSVADKLGERAFAVAVDVANEQSVADMTRAVVEQFGGIDIFVSNAGVLVAGGIDELEYDRFEFVTRVNYNAYFLTVKYVGAIMRAQFEADNSYMGDIIQINSKSGLAGSKKNFAYAGSKFGGIGLTQSFAMELAPYGIKVNSICPGNYLDGPLWCDPEKGLFVQYLNAGKVPGATSIEEVRRHYEKQVPLGRGCYPEDVAKALFYLVEQRYETGQALPVSGGQIMLK